MTVTWSLFWPVLFLHFQTFYERVNSASRGSSFFYVACGMKDYSKDVAELERYATTKIKFSKGFVFANLATVSEFEEQRSTFFRVRGRVRWQITWLDIDFNSSTWLQTWCLFLRLPWVMTNEFESIFVFILRLANSIFLFLYVQIIIVVCSYNGNAFKVCQIVSHSPYKYSSGLVSQSFTIQIVESGHPCPLSRARLIWLDRKF